MGFIERTAACVCGQLGITLGGEPRRVYACHCADCQATTGSAMAYRAIFPEAAIIAQAGEARRWRRTGAAGRWVEQAFCPTCGTLVWLTAEALSEAVSVSVGCFRDPAFPPPSAAHWSARRPTWLRLSGVADAS